MGKEPVSGLLTIELMKEQVQSKYKQLVKRKDLKDNDIIVIYAIYVQVDRWSG